MTVDSLHCRTNDSYISNLHRVINKSGKYRYSITIFFSDNPDYVINCLPGCCKDGQQPKYSPISVADAVSGGYKESYGKAEKHKAGKLAKGIEKNANTVIEV